LLYQLINLDESIKHNDMNIKTVYNVMGNIKPFTQREFNCHETLMVLTQNQNVWGSWGVNPRTICGLEKKCLVFKPNGRYFKDFVCVTLGWDDVYQVHFMNSTYKVVKSIEGVYFDMLVDVIDGYIETR
jgi:hypothetical protein